MSLVWPFSYREDGPNPGTDGSGQWRRIDQGQDLQAAVGTPVLAVADGVIVYAHDAQGFGDPYPVLLLDVRQVSPAVYYGHQYPKAANGQRVKTGDVVAYTQSIPGGNAWGLPGWLEIGWWDNGPTGNGQAMHDALINAPVFALPPPPPPIIIGDDVTRHQLTITTDADGNGWADLAVPFSGVVALFANGADPQTNAAYTPIPRLSASAEGQGTRVELEGGPAHGAVLVFVTTAT